MTRFGSAARWRLSIAMLLVGAMTLVAAMLFAPKSEAAPGANCSYYSDANHSTLVGQFGRDCCNNNVSWGIKTSFPQCGGCFVCVPPGP